MLVDTSTTLAEAAAIDTDVWQLVSSPIFRVVLTHKNFDNILGDSVCVGVEMHCAPQVGRIPVVDYRPAMRRCSRHTTDSTTLSSISATGV
nr:hypothetical protein [Mycobacterium leprae]